MKKQRQSQNYTSYIKQAQNMVLPSYQKIHNFISKISTSEKDYYYCICQKAKTFMFHTSYIILLDDKIKKTSFICSFELEKIQLNNSISDLAVLTKFFGGIQLAVIKSVQKTEDLRFNIKFKDKQEKSWVIQMQNNVIRNHWIKLIDQKIKQIKNKSLKPQKIQKKKQKLENLKQIQNNATYSKHELINILIAKLLNNVKTMITSLLNQSSLSQEDKKWYLNNKTNLYEGNFQILGDQIDAIDEKLKDQIENLKEKLKSSTEECKKMSLEVQKLKKNLAENELLHIFDGNLLSKLPVYKSFMKQQLEKYVQKQILKTEILYKPDHNNKINFHAYIDNHSNVCLIIKTAKDSYFAVFSQDPFSRSIVATKGGLILSLTNQKCFTLKQKQISVTYDEQYLIFGKSEIRLKSFQQKVFCNFGIQNGFFNTNGCKVDVLLNDGKNIEVEIEGYQIHEIFFKK